MEIFVYDKFSIEYITGKEEIELVKKIRIYISREKTLTFRRSIDGE